MTKPDAMERLREKCLPDKYGQDETQTWLGDARMEGVIACADVLEEAADRKRKRIAALRIKGGDELTIEILIDKAEEDELQATRLRSVVGGEK